MPTPPVSDAVLQQTIDTWAACGRRRNEAAAKLGLQPSGLDKRIKMCAERGIVPRVAPVRYTNKAGTRKAPAPAGMEPEIDAEPAALADGVLAELRRAPGTLESLSQRMGATRGQIIDALDVLQGRGHNVHDFGGRWSLEKTPALGTVGSPRHEYLSRPDHTFKFGWISDTHLGSRYSRHDVIERMFGYFAEEGVDRVFHAGNWIDGEASFNKHDLAVHGMDAQIRHLVDVWPAVDGLVTYAVAGDDHEGWYGQREGVDIGRYCERTFNDMGREDWIDLGYMEADILLRNTASGAASVLRVAHPGGGSAYATSYAPQKYVESLEGGDKPAVLLLGHWHKMEVLNIRNIWVIQTGCTQDQTPFARKKRLDFAIGGGITKITQDPDTGAIIRCKTEMFRFFNRGYYEDRNDRWSKHGPASLPQRESRPGAPLLRR